MKIFACYNKSHSKRDYRDDGPSALEPQLQKSLNEKRSVPTF